MREAKPRSLMRARAGGERVTNVELFFDLVYVFAVTQISHYLLAHPGAVGRAAASWMILGGFGLFLAGHAAFKAVVWRTPSWPRIGALAVLALLGLAAPHISALALGACAAAVVIAVAAIDYVQRSGADSPEAGQRD